MKGDAGGKSFDVPLGARRSHAASAKTYRAAAR